VELLRMSLDQRLAEIPKTSSFSKMELLREELDRTTTGVQTRDSVVAKMAALSGKLNLRFGVAPSGMTDISHMQTQSTFWSWPNSSAVLLLQE